MFLSLQTQTGERTAKSTYQSCKNGHLFACTSLWSVAEGPDISRQLKMNGCRRDSSVNNYNDRVSHIWIIRITSGRASKSITLLLVINMLWQILRVCLLPTETGSISTVVFPILSPGCSWFPLRNKNLPIKKSSMNTTARLGSAVTRDVAALLHNTTRHNQIQLLHYYFRHTWPNNIIYRRQEHKHQYLS